MESPRARSVLPYAAPIAAAALLAVDLVAWVQVLIVGPAAAYPDPDELSGVRVDWLGTPDAGPWLVLFAVPLLLVTSGLAVAGWGLRRAPGKALTAVGALTAAAFALLAWGYETSPLLMNVFCAACDAGGLEPVPGPVWYRPVRLVLLAAVGVCVIVAFRYAWRTPVTAAARLGSRPPAASVVAYGALAVAGCAGLLVAADWLGLPLALSSARVDQTSSDPGYVLDSYRADAYTYVGIFTAVLVPLAVVMLVVGVAAWRGRIRRTAGALLAGGFAGVCGIAAFVAVAAVDPLDQHHMVVTDVGWHAPVRGALALVGIIAQIVVLAGLCRRTTEGWLARPTEGRDAPPT